MENSTLEKEQYELLEHDETIYLIEKAQEGDKEAQAKLINHNLGLVKSILRRFSNRGHELEDLYQIGCMGLLKGIQNFDTSFGVKFSTYAVPMIMGEIRRFLRDDGIIKVSRSLKQTATKVNIAKEKLIKEFGREPSIQEISEEIKVDKEEIIMAIDANHQPDYLYDVIYEGDGSPIHLIDQVVDKETEDKDMLDRIALKEVLGKLQARERQIIIMRYFKDKTQTEIAKVLGISQVQVSRIEKKILENMKDLLTKM